MNIPEEDIYYGFKIVIIGAPGVGKTCLFNRYCFNSFHLNTKMTLGISFHSTYLRIKFPNRAKKKEGYVVNSIFDMAGQEKFRPMIPNFIKGTNGALLVFDSSNPSSFQKLDYWHDILVENIEVPNIPIILIASKCDLLDNDLLDDGYRDKFLNNENVKEFIESKNFNAFFMTSALENYNILKVFRELTVLMLKYHNSNAILI